MSAPSATRHVRLVAVGVITALVAGACLLVGVATASSATTSAFGWLLPRPAPAGWKHIALPSHGAILSYPASLSPIKGDAESISVGKRDRSGTIIVYLNATPKQGTESLGTWPADRIAHLHGETKDVHEFAHAQGLPFLSGGVGSCVTDNYVSVGPLGHHYQEIACFVQGRTKASVIVAAALRPYWRQSQALLERAIAAYRPT